MRNRRGHQDILFFGCEFGRPDGPLDLRIALIKKKSRNRSYKKRQDQNTEFDGAKTAEGIRVSAIDASVGLRMGKPACFALRHREFSTKTN